MTTFTRSLADAVRATVGKSAYGSNGTFKRVLIAETDDGRWIPLPTVPVRSDSLPPRKPDT